MSLRVYPHHRVRKDHHVPKAHPLYERRSLNLVEVGVELKAVASRHGHALVDGAQGAVGAIVGATVARYVHVVAHDLDPVGAHP